MILLTKYDTDIPDERIFFGKIRYGPSSGKKVSVKFFCMPEYISVKESLL